MDQEFLITRFKKQLTSLTSTLLLGMEWELKESKIGPWEFLPVVVLTKFLLFKIVPLLASALARLGGGTFLPR
jgi:hypothetical protein